MGRLPICSGSQVVRAFETLGWTFVRRASSHLILTKTGSFVTLSVPDYREVARGTLRSLILKSGVTVEEFVGALKG
ncbi:MAG: type II toxin-antitoxin system HicA family toxin [Fimbriimonadales bacterium]